MKVRHTALFMFAPIALTAVALAWGGSLTRPSQRVQLSSPPLAALLPDQLPVPPPTPLPDDFLPQAAEKPKIELPKRTTLVAVGDIMLSRGVASVIRQKKDVLFPFAATADFTRGADIAFANLETPISPGKPVNPAGMTFRSDPETVKGLTHAGYDVLSLANNHTPNFGQKGLNDTFTYLREAGIAYAGAGVDAPDARAPAVIERNGMRFAFLAYNDRDVVPRTYAAAEKHAGTAIMDVKVVAEDVRKALVHSDAVIVSMHSGHEYSFVPNASQTAFARAAIDAGAELVIGHHAHVVQTAEYYKGKWIFYGLGNFIFDQPFSMATKEGLAVKVTFEGPKVAELELFPVLIEKASQPHFSTGTIAGETVARLGALVQKRGDGYRLEAPKTAAP